MMVEFILDGEARKTMFQGMAAAALYQYRCAIEGKEIPPVTDPAKIIEAINSDPEMRKYITVLTRAASLCFTGDKIDIDMEVIGNA